MSGPGPHFPTQARKHLAEYLSGQSNSRLFVKVPSKPPLPAESRCHFHPPLLRSTISVHWILFELSQAFLRKLPV